MTLWSQLVQTQNLTGVLDKNNFQKTKIKSFEEEIKKLKNENTTLRKTF